MMPLDPKQYQFSPEENSKYFEKSILPKLKTEFNFSTQEKPIAHFTSGLPGAGKSKVLEGWERDHPNIIVIDADNLRKGNPPEK
jgi:adenylylsulfate kinase-like enzyme